MIFAARHRGEPLAIVEIPSHGLAHSAVERFGGTPRHFAAQLRGVDRVAAVVPRAVLDESHEARVVAARRELAQDSADRADDVEVRHLGVAADIVRRAGTPSCEHRPDRRAMIADVKPVANVAPIAIHRQRLAGDRVDDHQRDQLLRKLQRAVVVRAVRRERRQAVRVMIGAHQMVGRRLRRRVGAVRRIRIRFRERMIVAARASRRPRRSKRGGSGMRRASSCGNADQNARTVSSSLNVPTTLVSMNAAGPWIDRSTCVSAAKLTTARGRCWREQLADDARDRRCRRGRRRAAHRRAAERGCRGCRRR